MAEESVIKDTAKPAPTSPARSDNSSDSEGRPVREKLKQTSIDATGATLDQTMNDTTNGDIKTRDQSASGSDTERGRLTRKRSREEMDEDNDGEKPSEKKPELGKGERHHTRKRSRDVKDIANGPPFKPVANTVAPIDENDADELMTSPARKNTKDSSQSASATDTSPKNKRTREQVEITETESLNGTAANGKPVSSLQEERDSKRPRDKEVVDPAASSTETQSKIPQGSGFSNTSAASPFAAMTAKPQNSKMSGTPEAPPQTSGDKFKTSGFGGFASTEKSPFGSLGGSGAASPFGAASGSKLSSFAGSAKPAAPASSGFGALGGSTTSSFGGSTFGTSLAGGFGSLGGVKSGLSSFATPSDLTIKGLKSKPSAFGTPADQANSDDSDDDNTGDDDGDEKDEEDERRYTQPLLTQQPQETGEEGEDTIWTGRAKLYNMSGEGSSRGWKERGTGNFKLNVTTEEPKKARFVLRADGTHRLLLNTAVTRQLKFGDSNGEKSKDGKLLFNSPTPTGELEMHLLKLKAERGIELWDEVDKLKETEL